MTTVELVAAFFGILGTFLLAFKGRYAGYGFVAYLVSNVGWIIFALDRSQYPFLIQQIFFTISSIVGILVWIVRPKLLRTSPT